MTFLEKYEILKKSIPVPALLINDTKDSEYVDVTFWSKNCFYCFEGHRLVDGLYTTRGWGNKLVDCHTVTESEKCYKCIDCNKCHSCTYLIGCNDSKDCHFSVFLNSCSDCFGCVSLTHKKYCIFNKQCTKEEYFKKVKKLKKENPEYILKRMFDLKQKIPHPASQQFNNENCLYGDYIYNSKNCYWCFNAWYCENSGYNFLTNNLKNCWDNFSFGGNEEKKASSELCYQMLDSTNCYRCAYLNISENCSNCFYGQRLLNCTDCFGCVGLKNKKYCILNNQLTKEQYTKALKEIKKELAWKA